MGWQDWMSVSVGQAEAPHRRSWPDIDLVDRRPTDKVAIVLDPVLRYTYGCHFCFHFSVK